jgi:predicted amidohydrolase YtcJ
MSHVQVDNCFDSHVHWLATGQMSVRLQLHHLKCEEDLRQCRIMPTHFQGEWLVGFGWDHHAWPGQQLPTRRLLDDLFPDHPVSLSRADGHAAWVNTRALQRIGVLDSEARLKSLPAIKGGRFVLDKEGLPTGVLVDLAKSLVDEMIPEPDSNQIRSALLSGVDIFNRAGFTHIRDMACSESQFTEACHLYESGFLTLAVEQFFSADDPRYFDQALGLAKRARAEKIPLIRASGLKIYYDGALGSEGALLSAPYASGSGTGLELLTSKELEELMRQSWESGFSLAVHTIGDEAVHRVILAAEAVWNQGRVGHLHLEHVEMLRPETVARMVDRPVTCHLQPCHWLSDRQWLKAKLGPLTELVFPWRLLQENQINFYFGSDSPIERSSLANNLKALEESALQGVPPLLGSPLTYHSHPDKAWAPNTYTHFQDGQPTAVVFSGSHLG